MREKFTHFFNNAIKNTGGNVPEGNNQSPEALIEINKLCRNLQLKAWHILKDTGNITYTSDEKDIFAKRIQELSEDHEIRFYRRAEAMLETPDPKVQRRLILACPGRWLAAPVIVDDTLRYGNVYLKLANNDNAIMKSMHSFSPIPALATYLGEMKLGNPTMAEVKKYEQLLNSAKWIYPPEDQGW